MMTIDLAALQHALNLLPDQHRGPAGVAGVVKDGQVIAQRAWGYADMYRRLPMTAQTRLPICSISKHLTCAVLLDLFGDPSALDPLLPDLLPNYQAPLPIVAHLCHNQSGLRDYWALTVLHGAEPEDIFTEADGLRLLAQTRSGHFLPGAHYSYSNGNFRLLAELINRASGRDFADLMQERVFAPAGMKTAELAPDTRYPLDGVIGYEGNDDVGFLPAKNAIHWHGDAGVSASLADMLAWETYIDATRDDVSSLYNRLSVPTFFADGTPAAYGYGLRRDVLAGFDVTGHGGALRGFSCFRMHVASERLSIVVMFNHDSNAMRAAWSLMEAALDCTITTATEPVSGWDGLWMDDRQSLMLRTTGLPAGVRLHYAPTPALLSIDSDGSARGLGVSLRKEDTHLLMQRPGENLEVQARPLVPVEWADGASIAGRFQSDEINAGLEIISRDGATYVVFDGMLGQGPMERMYSLAEDMWSITTRRSMDASAPGEWTAQFWREGKELHLMLGCWLARKIPYRRIG